jgi:hypothetical protein
MTWEVRHRGFRIWFASWALVLLVISSRGFAFDSEPFAAGNTLTTNSTSGPSAVAPLPELILVQAAKVQSTTVQTRFPEGSHLARLSGEAIAGELPNLTSELFAAADPQNSFDGERVIFSGQKLSTEPWQIWEMRVDGTEKRQLTDCAEDCFRPGYLPDEEIVFTVGGLRGAGKSSYLAVAKRDGSPPHPITFGPGEWKFETVLRDGRVLASASSPLADEANQPRARMFYTMRPDGTGLESLRCEHKEIATRTEASELADGSIIYTIKIKAEAYGGALTEIQQGDLNETAIGTKGEMYSSPRAVGAERVVVARSVKSTGKPGGKFELYAFDLKHRSVGQKIYGDAKLNSLQAIPIAKHEIPKKFSSLVNSASKTGFLIALDSYASVDEKNGRIDTAIANVRVWTLQSSTQKEVVLGDASVEKDGSFYVEVPADQAVRFELLDATGRTIRVEQGWIWSRAGEQRGCAGCHSDKALAPENRWPMTLKRFDTPTKFVGGQGQGTGAEANE